MAVDRMHDMVRSNPARAALALRIAVGYDRGFMATTANKALPSANASARSTVCSVDARRALVALWVTCLTLVVSCCSVVGASVDTSDRAGDGANASVLEQRLEVVSWNVLYGFDHGRSVARATEWIRQRQPDVVALQELNGFTTETLRETAARFDHPHAVLQKESGFAMGLTSTAPIEVLERRVRDFHHGFLHCRTHGIDFFVVHFCPGKEHEVEFVLGLARARVAGGARVAILGDFNSHARKDADFLAGKRVEPSYAAIASVESAGFVDVVHRFDRNALYSCPSPITIPEWSKDEAELDSKRQRIDFILVDGELARRARSATIVRSRALDAISDHYPVVAEFAIPVATHATAPPRFAFGVIADCQYCAAPAVGRRRYSESDSKLQACVDHLAPLDLEYVVHLGDFIDRDFESFDVVAPIYDSLDCATYHVLGNHDYSVANEHKPKVPARLGMPARYYDFAVEGWRFVVLDGNDISFHAHPAGTPAHTMAAAYHRKHVPDAPRWNGALGVAQLEWLESVLEKAGASNESVMLFCHFPVFPADVHNLWNAAEVRELIRRYPCVKAYLNGHNHAGNYAVEDGVHYLTLQGMVDTKHTSYAVVEVRKRHLSILGFGRERDRTLRLR